MKFINKIPYPLVKNIMRVINIIIAVGFLYYLLGGLV